MSQFSDEFFELSTDMLCVADFKGYFVELNPAWTRNLGWSVEELLSKPFIEFVHPEDRERTQRESERLFSGQGNTISFENRYQHKFGGYRWLTWTASISAPKGKTFAVARDITDHRRDRILAAQTNQVARIGGWEVDFESGRVFWSRETHLIHETDPDFYQPKLSTAFDFYPEQSRKTLAAAFQRLKEIGQGYDLELEFVTARGRRLWIRAIGRPEYEFGQVVKAYGTFQDISEIKDQEILLRNVVDHLPVALFAKSAKDDYRFILWNKKSEELFGLTQTQVLGKTDYDFFPKEQADFFRMKDRVAMAEGKLVDIPEEPLESPKLGHLWVHTKKVPVNDAEGNPDVLLGISEDVTLQRESRNRLDLALRSSKMGVWEWYLPKNTMIWDDTQYLIYGVERSDFQLTRESWVQLIHPEDRPKVKDAWNAVQAEGSSISAQFRVSRPDGTERHIRSTAYIERSEIGAILRVVGLNWDVTEQVLHQMELERQRAVAVHSSKMATLGEMAGSIAHEINNPLAIIVGKATQMTEALKKNRFDNAKLIEGLARIEATAMRISKIIRGLKSFSRNAEKDPMVETPVRSIIEDALEICRERFRRGDFDVRLKIPESPDDRGLLLQCRSTQLTQVLVNLLHNAHDAVEKLKERWVEIEVKDEGPSVLMSVTDSGHGIPPNLVDKVMMPFFTTKDVGKGTGLGLSIAKGIIEDHRGTLEYDANHAHTRFVIQLPKTQTVSKNPAA